MVHPARLLVSTSLAHLCAGAHLGWDCKAHEQPKESNGRGMGIALRGRRMLTDREHVPESIAYADLRHFPKKYDCAESANRNASLAGILRSMMEPSLVGAHKENGHAHSIFKSSGALLIRGLPLSNASALSELLGEVNASFMPYTGGVAPRGEMSKGVMQASVEPAEVTIEPHWEMSYAALFPHLLLFFCHRRPSNKGEGLTPITDGRAVLRTLRKLGIAQAFEEQGVLYRFYYPSKLDNTSMFSTFVWEVVFRTESKDEVEAFLSGRKRDFPSLEWTWTESEPGGPPALEYTFRKEAVVPHPHSPSEQVWFNQITSMHRSYFHAHATFPDLLDVPVPFASDGNETCQRRYPFDTSYGDGREISEETLRTIRQVYWNNTVVFQWEPGDLLILDNMVAAHGRMDYNPKESERELFVSLLKVG